MARTMPEERLGDLLAAATRVFIEHGYRRTQIADVADALGVAKGTIYLYVQSKEALFYAALRWADGEAPATSEVPLPLVAPPVDQIAALVRERLEEESVPPPLAAALDRPVDDVADVGAELAEILEALFDTAYRSRTVVKLIERCGRDPPEIARTFYEGGRIAQLDALIRYFDARTRAGALAAIDDPRVTARFVIETVATWAVHIHWDPHPQELDPDTARRAVLALLGRSLGAEPS